MALTSGCTFNVPIEDFDAKTNGYLLHEFIPTVTDYSDSVVAYPRDIITNNAVENSFRNATFMEDEDADERRQESEDDVIVLNEEEYCLPVESESEAEEEENPIQNNVDCKLPENSNDKDSPSKLSYTAAASRSKPVYAEAVARTRPPDIIYSGFTSYDRIKRSRDSLERVKLYVRGGFKIMVLLRGAPGSGKSYMACKLIKECGDDLIDRYYHHVHSTDNFFYLNKKGVYQFEPDKLDKAHHWNNVNVLHAIREELTPIIVDNTHTQMWEMKTYASMAVCAGYELEVMEPDTAWAFNIVQLTKKNQHGVSKASITAALNRYEHNVTALSLLKYYNLEYSCQNAPPQMGVRELQNRCLVDIFNSIRNHVQPCTSGIVSTKRLSKAEKRTRKNEKKAAKKERRRIKKLMKEAILKTSQMESKVCEPDVVEKSESELDDESLLIRTSDSNDSSKEDMYNSDVDSSVSKDISTPDNEDGEEDSTWASIGTWSTIDNGDDDSSDNDKKLEENDKFDVEELELYDLTPVSNISHKNEVLEKTDRFDTEEVTLCDSISVSKANVNDKKYEEITEFDGGISTFHVNGNEKLPELPYEDEREKAAADCIRSDCAGDVAVFGDQDKKNCFNDELKTVTTDTEATITVKQYQFSNQLYDALAKNVPRLKCFERFHNESDDCDKGSEFLNGVNKAVADVEKVSNEDVTLAAHCVPVSPSTIPGKEVDAVKEEIKSTSVTTACEQFNNRMSNISISGCRNTDSDVVHLSTTIPTKETWFREISSNSNTNSTSDEPVWSHSIDYDGKTITEDGEL